MPLFGGLSFYEHWWITLAAWEEPDTPVLDGAFVYSIILVQARTCFPPCCLIPSALTFPCPVRCWLSMPVTMATALTAQCWPTRRWPRIWNTSWLSCTLRNVFWLDTAWVGRRRWSRPWRRLGVTSSSTPNPHLLFLHFPLIPPSSSLSFIHLLLCLFASVQFSGQAGGGGHQPIAVVLVLQLPLLHPGDAGDEDLQRHPSFHCQADGRGSAAHVGWGQK